MPIRPPLWPLIRPFLATPGGGGRASAAYSQHVGEFDRLDQVDQGAAHDRRWVDVFETQLAQLVLADVLDMPGSGV